VWIRLPVPVNVSHAPSPTELGSPATRRGSVHSQQSPQRAARPRDSVVATALAREQAPGRANATVAYRGAGGPAGGSSASTNGCGCARGSAARSHEATAPVSGLTKTSGLDRLGESTTDGEELAEHDGDKAAISDASV